MLLTILYTNIFWRYIVHSIEQIVRYPSMNVENTIRLWLRQRKHEAIYAQFMVDLHFLSLVSLLDTSI
jgi:hypothetical protein